MPRDPNRPPAEDDEFFVGYLPTPPGTRRFVALVVVVMLLLTAGMAAGATYLQRFPSDARGRRASVTGLVRLSPEPHLVAVDEATGEIATYLMGGGGKSAVGRAVRDRDGAIASLSGRLLSRGGRSFLEVYRSEDGALEEATEARLRAVEPEDLGEVEVVGEVMDSKCFYGAMHPGNGPTHRPCAQLCILGGVPPVLVAYTEAGEPTHYLLAGPEGDIRRDVLRYAGQAVRVRGALERRADLLILRVDPARIDRL
jgi:hypothetical protein